MRPVYLFGDSHSLPFVQIQKEFSDFNARAIGAGRIVDNFILKDMLGTVITTPLLTHTMEAFNIFPFAKMQAKRPQARIVLLLGTGEGVRMSLSDRWTDMWFSVPGLENEETPPKRKTFVPFRVVSGFMEHRLGQFFEGVKLLAEMGYRSNLEILAAPPPYASNKTITKLYDQKRKGEVRIHAAEPQTRLKIWLTAQQVVQEFCARENIGFIPNPPEVVDKQGFLKAAFERDGMHANVDYARVVTRHLLGQEPAAEEISA